MRLRGLGIATQTFTRDGNVYRGIGRPGTRLNAATPEPSSLLLLGTGIAALAVGCAGKVAANDPHKKKAGAANCTGLESLSFDYATLDFLYSTSFSCVSSAAIRSDRRKRRSLALISNVRR